MHTYYLIFACSYLLSTWGTYLNKKYQLTAGTGRSATAVYMIVNGIASALLPAFMFFFTDESLEMTPYSLVFAFATVMCAAIATVGTLKAYEKGQIAIVTTFTTVGSIVMSCAWGILFLKERITVEQAIAIILMLISVLIVTVRKEVKIDKSVLWLLVLAAVTSSFTSVLSKQHQVEKTYATVNTLSYSLWVGIIRSVVFGLFLLYDTKKNGGEMQKLSGMSFGYAIGASAISGLCYIINLITAVVLPITITSPLGTALSIFLSAIMARVAYHEKMTKTQMAGMVLCVIGIFIFAWSK
ncbi:MAG: DMT family transporter [Roseburia sp.]|nr:DMT family transporter [Roseburia sp.]